LNKIESIIKLKEFNNLINNYFDGKYENQKEIKSEINMLLPIAEQLVKKSNSLKLMTMAPPPAIGGMIVKNFNPFDMIFTSFWGRSIIPEICNMVEQSISKYENDLVDFNELKITKNCNTKYPTKITFKWLFDNVPLPIWITFFGIVISSFILGNQLDSLMTKYNGVNSEIRK